MADAGLPAYLRDRLGLRIEPRMAEYIRRRLCLAIEPFFVIGGDARTGVPRQFKLDPRNFPEHFRAATESIQNSRPL